MRPLLPEDKIDSGAARQMAAFHSNVVDEVKRAIAENAIVVVGMKQNPVVKAARKALDEAGKAHTYIGYGSYLGGWKERLAIKLWSGWPTFPQVFVAGKLIGGCRELKVMIKDGKL